MNRATVPGQYLHAALSLDQLLAQLDPAKKGPQFERLCRWYLTNAPEYRGRFKHVWLWREWPDAWGPDAGIDLVAEEHGLWAIQAKAIDPAYAIKKADMDSFLSESSRRRPRFAHRLLIATTDRLGPTAKRTLDAQREPVGYLLRFQLARAPLDWPSSPDVLPGFGSWAPGPRGETSYTGQPTTSGGRHAPTPHHDPRGPGRSERRAMAGHATGTRKEWRRAHRAARA